MHLVLLLLWMGFSPTMPSRAAEVAAWGGNGCGQTDVPSGLSNIVAVAAGDTHSVALTAAGQAVAWGGTANSSFSDYGQAHKRGWLVFRPVTPAMEPTFRSAPYMRTDANLTLRSAFRQVALSQAALKTMTLKLNRLFAAINCSTP
jgi:hypothetical protein